MPVPVTMWEKIRTAVDAIVAGGAKRIDGDGWTAYAVGSTVIRIDLKVTTRQV